MNESEIVICVAGSLTIFQFELATTQWHVISVPDAPCAIIMVK